jgi:hypothetical protein
MLRNKFHTAFSGVGVVAGLAIGALLFSGAAKAITDSVFQYSSPKMGRFSIPAGSMVPENTYSSSGYSSEMAFPDDGVGLTNSVNNACFRHSVLLPHQSTLTEMTVWYRGTGYVALTRYRFSDNLRQVLADEGLDSATRTSSVLIFPVNARREVNNQAFSYDLSLCLTDPGSFFYGARVNYTYTTAGD